MAVTPGNSPNFFILGAPKCGTTSLARYLAGHPQIFISEPKEPSYFSRSLLTDWERQRAPAHQYDWDSYRQLFASATAQQTHRGEATTRYLRCEAALQEIKARCPEARLIAMLRDPVAMVESWHAQKLWERQETEPVLERAWRLETDRQRGERLPARLKARDALFYSEVAKLGSQVTRLLEVFPAGQVHLILLDDLRNTPRRVYQGVLSFLGLPDDGRTDFTVHNPRRNPAISRILSKIGVVNPRSPTGKMSPAFAAELRQHFAPEIVKLERILNRDLSAWK